MRFPLVLVSFVLCAGLQAQTPTTWFVDAAIGSDTNPGLTRNAPLRSLTYAVSVAFDDDTIVVLPGTYSPTGTGEIYPIQLGNNRSQLRVKIIAEGGPAVTILDGEQQMVGAGVPMLRILYMAEGTSVEGFRFTNTGSASYWSMAIRLGSTSGQQYAAKDVSILGCVFDNCYRGIVVFGSEPANGNQTEGCRIHDNLFVNCQHRSLAVWGPGVNYAYNNTIVNSGHDSIWVDSLPTQASSNAVIQNNVVVGGAVGGIAVGPNGLTAVIESNLAWQNFADWSGFTPTASNLVADPLFVSPTDLHLSAGSPALQSGSTAGLPELRLDHDGMSRLHDSDGNGTADLDRGAYQRSDYGMTLSGTWDLGQTVQFGYRAAAPGGGVLVFATRRSAIPLLNFGVFAVDPFTVLASAPIGPVPSSVPFQIPNLAALHGAYLVMQGVYVGASIHFLNAVERGL
ncbi:MAG: right-handed parallel beta-helix repeat-containing protein [Planctomycetes bacterium]|nr:right-handed parallel beta-helix repeat-containing protein [Planctomycetota bacterium]